MPLLTGVAAALLLLFILAGITAAIVALLVLPVLRHRMETARRERTLSPWDGDLEEPQPVGWSDTSPLEVRDWWSSGDSPAETVVIGGTQRAGATAVAERPTTARQIWTIHPDHTAHWQDEAGDCKWCREDPL